VNWLGLQSARHRSQVVETDRTLDAFLRTDLDLGLDPANGPGDEGDAMFRSCGTASSGVDTKTGRRPSSSSSSQRTSPALPRLLADRLTGIGSSPSVLSCLRVFLRRPLLDGLTFSQKARQRGLDLSLAELVPQPVQPLARSHESNVPAPVASTETTTFAGVVPQGRLRPALG
jgi:hypothetical protein